MCRSFLSRHIFLALLILLYGSHFLEAAELTTTLDSGEIPVGGYTYLNIKVEGKTNAEVDAPVVDGLVFRKSGNSSNTSIVNGRISRSVTLRFTVLGEKEGTYTIPPLTVTTGKETLMTEAFRLKVTASTETRSTSTRNSDTLTAEDVQQIAFINLSIGSNKAYVGEKIPLSVKLYLNTKMRFNQIQQPPSLENESIMISPLGQDFKQSVQSVGGQRYDVISWNTDFTAVKPGQTTLQSSLELTVLVRARRQTSSFPSSIFDSDFFSPSYQSVPLLARSNDLNFEIIPFPKNQPATFSGAIGEFNLKVSASPTEISEGDPITLHIDIGGKGNFDRVFHDGLPASAEFKTYTPESEFVSDNAFSLEGTKSFKQAIIPINPEQHQVPSISFTFLNSTTGQFEILESPPIPIRIVRATEDSGSNANQSGSSSRRRETIDTDGLISFSVSLDKAHKSIRPLCTRTIYRYALWGTPFALILLSMGLSFIIQKNNRINDRIIRDQKRELKSIAEQISKAKKSTDTIAFIQAAAQYTRAILGYLWGTPAHAITSADAKARLKNVQPAIIKILSLSETIAYAGTEQTDIDTGDLYSELKKEWQKIESSLNLS